MQNNLFIAYFLYTLKYMYMYNYQYLYLPYFCDFAKF